MHDQDHAQDLAFSGRQAVEAGYDQTKNIRLLEDTYLELAGR
jgi:hypothetical protein